MKIVRLFLFLAFVLVSFSGVAGNIMERDTVTLIKTTSDTARTGTPDHQMNIIKLNLLSPFFKNISVQYERVINKFLSVTLTARYMPNTTIPYVNFIYKLTGDNDPATEDAIKSIRISNYSISPEVRFYTGKKGYGKGFYVAVSYRYTAYNLSDMHFIYANYPAPDSVINFTGSMSTHYAGVLLGTQWFLGKHFTLDWWFFGPLIGFESSNFAGLSSVPLSQEDQNDLKDALESLGLPNTEKTVYVDENGGSVSLRGLMYGVNFGFALGFRF